MLFCSPSLACLQQCPETSAVLRKLQRFWHPQLSLNGTELKKTPHAHSCQILLHAGWNGNPTSNYETRVTSDVVKYSPRRFGGCRTWGTEPWPLGLVALWPRARAERTRVVSQEVGAVFRVVDGLHLSQQLCAVAFVRTACNAVLLCQTERQVTLLLMPSPCMQRCTSLPDNSFVNANSLHAMRHFSVRQRDR